MTMLDIEPCALQCALLSASLSGLDAARASALECDGGLSLAASNEQRDALDELQDQLSNAAHSGALANVALHERSQEQSDPPDGSETHPESAWLDWRTLELPDPTVSSSQLQPAAPTGTAAFDKPTPQPHDVPVASQQRARATTLSADRLARAALPDKPFTLAASSTCASAACKVNAAVFDWSQPYSGPDVDVVLACDVLYEDAAAEPLAQALPAMLGGRHTQRILLADPPARAPEYRKRFMTKLAENDVHLAVEVNRVMRGSRSEVKGDHDVQLVVLRRKDGGDTVGLPLSAVG